MTVRGICPLCKVNCGWVGQSAHFRKVHPEYRFSKLRRGGRTDIFCDTCGVKAETYPLLVRHYQSRHLSTEDTSAEEQASNFLIALKSRLTIDGKKEAEIESLKIALTQSKLRYTGLVKQVLDLQQTLIRRN